MANTHPDFIPAITLENFCNQIALRTGISYDDTRKTIDSFVKFYMEELNPSEVSEEKYKKGQFILPELDQAAIDEIMSEEDTGVGEIEEGKVY